MKRSLSILSVFVLFAFLFSFSFAPVVKAEGDGAATGTGTEGTPQQGATLEQQSQESQSLQPAGKATAEPAVEAEKAKKEKQYKIRLRFEVQPDENGEVPFKNFVVAKLIDKTDKEVGQVEGTWTVEVDGKEYKKFEGSKDKKIRVELPEDFQVVVVKFEGKIDGQDVKVKKKHEVINADLEITHKEENGKDVFTATIKGVEKAEGEWYLGYGTEDSEDAIDFVIAQGGATFTHAFENVKPGKYVVVAMFVGTVNDGDEVGLINMIEFEKKENGGEVKPPANDPGDKQPPVLDPDETKKQIEEGQKGGKLPKTATTYPAGALAGLVLLLVGFAVLRLRRA